MTDLELRQTATEDLAGVAALEQGDARAYIIPYSLERHRRELDRPDVVYRSIHRAGELIGFVILVLDPDGRSVELRRIVVAEPGRGHGTAAMSQVEALCHGELGRSRIWLDVFGDNQRARHFYEKCGFVPFGRSAHEGRTLLLYEKLL